MDKSQWIRIAGNVMSDRQPIALTITIRDAWMLISGIQLATRHPELGPTKQILIEIARQFQGVIIQAHPESEELLEAGWNQDFDEGTEQ